MSENIAYTIGDTIAYDLGLATEEGFSKVGRKDGYEGGWVWRSPIDVADFYFGNDNIVFPVSIYAIELPNGWDIDVSKEPASDGIHRLINDSKILYKFTDLIKANKDFN